ncbi:long-chain fatty acid transport protein 1 [Delitschia confertaspora ATCC 74209]|uniref:Very long-chain fatty acid transport protein n=1 Tax=Delitschia confertaspora ATCC 74209 TaxID=1513339 RepID=A0A9P4JVC7_9PLEO|nr:long-chain fatty acid transport protein 1 [Delitschia confertaspora ATCC 74209]
MALTAASTIAGIAGLSAYLNAKYHIRHDLDIIRRKKASERWYAELEKQNRISPWYGFATNAALYPNEEAIWSRDRCYSWKETHDRAVQWGRFFLSKGVKPGDLVATYLMNSAEFTVIWLALWGIGCAPAMLNYHLKGNALIHCLKACEAKILVVDDDQECRERFEEVRTVVEDELGVTPFYMEEMLEKEVKSLSTQPLGNEYRDGVQGEDALCLLYTSGTTGLPKAGVFTMARFHERGVPENPPFNQKGGPDGDRWYNCMPIFHGTGGISTVGALNLGMSVGIGKKFSVKTFWDDIHDSRSTVWVYVGEAARYLLNAPPHPLERNHPRLRGMFGNGMRPDVWTRFKERFDVPEVMEFFSSTEGVFGMAIHSKGPFTANSVGLNGVILRAVLRNTWIPVGIDPETGAIIRNPKTGYAVRKSYNEGGEILVKVPDESAFAGYYNNPAATAKKFERDVFKKGDLYYRTGDALRRDDDGRWFFLDRLGDTFRWKSENVSTAEVAEVLGKYSGVAEANVYGVLVPRHDGRAGCVALRLDDGVAPSTFNFRDFLQYARGKLPKYAVPVFIRLVTQTLQTANNKQNKGPLRDEGVELERYGEKVDGGRDDVVLWINPESDEYVRFGKGDLEVLRSGSLTL